MTSLVRRLLNLAKKHQQWQCPVWMLSENDSLCHIHLALWMLSENLTVCAISTLHSAFSHKGCNGGCYRQLPARVLTLKVVAVYKCADLPSQFLQLHFIFLVCGCLRMTERGGSFQALVLRKKACHLLMVACEETSTGQLSPNLYDFSVCSL